MREIQERYYHPYLDVNVMHPFLKLMYDYAFLFLMLDNNLSFRKKIYWIILKLKIQLVCSFFLTLYCIYINYKYFCLIVEYSLLK